MRDYRFTNNTAEYERVNGLRKGRGAEYMAGWVFLIGGILLALGFLAQALGPLLLGALFFIVGGLLKMYQGYLESVYKQ